MSDKAAILLSQIDPTVLSEDIAYDSSRSQTSIANKLTSLTANEFNTLISQNTDDQDYLINESLKQLKADLDSIG
jgi:hypothetical protein